MSQKILIADDDMDNRTIAKEILEASGYKILLAANGLEALEMATREEPDLIILDMSMPKMNGWETAKRIRQIPRMASTPIVAFTAHALAGDDLKAKVAGCDDYLSKPCVPRDMVRKVETWLGPKKENPEGGTPV